MTNEQRNMAQDILDGLLRDEYVRGYMDATNDQKDIGKLEEQNRKLYTVLKKLMEMRGDCFIPNEGDWWDNMAQEAIADVEGDNQ